MNKPDLINILPVDLQAAHSKSVSHSTYAVETDATLEEVPHLQEFEYLKVSQIWWDLLGITKANRIMPNVENISNVPDEIISFQNIEKSEQNTKNYSASDVKSIQNALRFHLGESAKFRNNEQLMASLEMASKDDSLIIAPCGFGKSLLINLKNVVNRKIDVVIVPLRALLLNMVNRNIGSQFPGDENSKILIIHAKDALKKEFQDFLVLKASNDQLGAIIYDEIHLFLDPSFRPELLQCLFLRTTLQLNVPVKLLTASLTKMMRSKLHEIFGHVTKFEIDCTIFGLSYHVVT